MATEPSARKLVRPCGTEASPSGDFYLGGVPCTANMIMTLISLAFERSSKRRRGFPSETHVKRGVRVVHGDKELIEKLGRNDPCPCGSNKCF